MMCANLISKQNNSQRVLWSESYRDFHDISTQHSNYKQPRLIKSIITILFSLLLLVIITMAYLWVAPAHAADFFTSLSYYTSAFSTQIN